MKIKIFLCFLSVLSFCACSSLSPKLDAERAKNVHKVAIVAFEIIQQKATDNLGLGAFKSLKDGPDAESEELKKMALNVANSFAKQIQSKTNWQVVPMKDVIANAEYHKKVESEMTGARGVLTASKGSESIYPKGLLDVAAFRRISQEERVRLAQALGVDALVEIISVNSMEQSWLSLGHATGDGAFAITAKAGLQVYDLRSDDPIWRSQNVSGEVTEKSDSLPENLSKRERLSQLGEKAANSAIQKLMETYSL